MHTLKNLTKGPKGVTVKGGQTVYIDGEATSQPLDLEAHELASAKGTGWFEVVDGKKAAPAPVSDELNAVHRGGGSYSIMRGDTPVEEVESLKKDEAEAFNALDAEGKAAFVAERTKKAE